MKFTDAQLLKIHKLPHQYQLAISQAKEAQRQAFAQQLDQHFSFCELGSLGGFLLKRGTEYRWVSPSGQVN